LDVYTQVWRQATAYDSSRGTPLAWLLTIARTRAIDRLRSGKQDKQRSKPLEYANSIKSATGDPEESAALSEQQRLIRDALAVLSTHQREVIELAYYQGLSQSEIACALGQPLGTVKTRTRLGLMKLRETLRPVLKGEVVTNDDTKCAIQPVRQRDRLSPAYGSKPGNGRAGPRVDHRE